MKSDFNELSIAGQLIASKCKQLGYQVVAFALKDSDYLMIARSGNLSDILNITIKQGNLKIVLVDESMSIRRISPAGPNAVTRFGEILMKWLPLRK